MWIATCLLVLLQWVQRLQCNNALALQLSFTPRNVRSSMEGAKSLPFLLSGSIRRRALFQQVSSSSEGEEEYNDVTPYNDFGDFVVGSDDDDNINERESELFGLLGQSREEELIRSTRLAQNWRSGNWKVRGFALDKRDASRHFRDEDGTPDSSSGQHRLRQRGVDSANDAYYDKAGNSNNNNIRVSRIVLDQSTLGTDNDYSNIIAVGRTDGSVCLVRLGTEYLAKFTAIPKLTMEEGSWNDGGSTTDETNDDLDQKPIDNNNNKDGPRVKVESKLVRSNVPQENKARRADQVNVFDPSDLYYEDDSTSEGESSRNNNNESTGGGTPFEVLHQFQAHDESITALLFGDQTIYTAGGTSGEIKVWFLPDDVDDANSSGVTEKVVLVRSLSNAHADTIVAIKTISFDTIQNDHYDLLLTASKDGSFALWNINDDESGGLQCRHQLKNEYSEPLPIACVDVDTSITENYVVYFGTSTGHVIGYALSELIGSSATDATVGDDFVPTPICKFLAHQHDGRDDSVVVGGGGVTAIMCVGSGTLPLYSRSNSGVKTSVLLTGGSDGTVKQWEMIMRKTVATGGGESTTGGRMTAPRFKLEHWPRLSTQRMKRRAHLFTGHSGSITAIMCAIDSTIMLSAGSDGTVRVWDISKGHELFRMDGFTNLSSLCLDNELLVTDGMEEYVCIHDFDVDDDDDREFN